MGKSLENTLETEELCIQIRDLVANVGKKHVMFEKPMTRKGLDIPPLKMVMTGGWLMTLFYPHVFPSQ